ncbi:hypothetical protein [Flexithrix dorotheae]|uniref:hypothetical protein n=1 Tax=Flexithrix dorotheae TaxID=70993 RepID=UPI00037C7D35|nr:hypothetical protein [Flexithrix dorotheae]
MKKIIYTALTILISSSLSAQTSPNLQASNQRISGEGFSIHSYLDENSNFLITASETSSKTFTMETKEEAGFLVVKIQECKSNLQILLTTSKGEIVLKRNFSEPEFAFHHDLNTEASEIFFMQILDEKGIELSRLHIEKVRNLHKSKSQEFFSID